MAIKESEIQHRTPTNVGLIKTPAPMLDPSVEMAQDTRGVFSRHMVSIKRKPF